MSVNDRIATQQKRYVKLTPTNNSSNAFSYAAGNNILRFSIAEQDAYLLANQTELQFTFKVFYKDFNCFIQKIRYFNMRTD